MADLLDDAGVAHESIYGRTKLLLAPSFSVLGQRHRVFSKLSNLMAGYHRKFTGQHMFNDPDHWTSRMLDFNLCDEAESLNRFEFLAKKDLNFIKIAETIKRCDSIVVNGEGDMIFDPRRRTLRFMLLIMAYGKKLGKPVYFLNAMVSPSPTAASTQELEKRSFDSLRGCAAVQLRDRTSYEIVRLKAPDIQCSYVPDSLFTWNQTVAQLANKCLQTSGDVVLPFGFEHLYGNFDFSEPYICISGSSLAPKYEKAKMVSSYVSLCQKLRGLKLRIFLVITCVGDNFLKEVSAITQIPIIPAEIPIVLGAAILARARLFVSGRYHPSIMASLGGTPFIMFDSNSHKSASLQDLLEYDHKPVYALADLEAQIPTIYQHAENLIAQPSKRQTISATVTELASAARTGFLSAFSTSASSVR